MDRNEALKLKNKAILAAVSALVALLAVSAVSFAWFTSNRSVNTSRVSASTDDAEMSLLLSPTGGSSFKGSTECDITQVNKQDVKALIPVSTSDLENFCYLINEGVYGDVDQDDEDYYYHGRIFVKAEGISGTVNLFLEKPDELFVKSEEASYLLNAARLGVVVEGMDPVILYLSEEENDEDDQVSNTYIGSKIQDDGIVLDSSSASVKAVEDPSVYFKEYCVEAEDPKPLATIRAGRVYQIDLYFYLEGCDPDCSDSLYENAGTMQLFFYGAVDTVE